jgi:hypothetical protein
MQEKKKEFAVPWEQQSELPNVACGYRAEEGQKRDSLPATRNNSTPGGTKSLVTARITPPCVRSTGAEREVPSPNHHISWRPELLEDNACGVHGRRPSLSVAHLSRLIIRIYLDVRRTSGELGTQTAFSPCRTYPALA